MSALLVEEARRVDEGARKLVNEASSARRLARAERRRAEHDAVRLRVVRAAVPVRHHRPVAHERVGARRYLRNGAASDKGNPCRWRSLDRANDCTNLGRGEREVVDVAVARIVEHGQGVRVADPARQFAQAEQVDVDALAEDVPDHDVRLELGRLIEQGRPLVVLHQRD